VSAGGTTCGGGPDAGGTTCGGGPGCEGELTDAVYAKATRGVQLHARGKSGHTTTQALEVLIEQVDLFEHLFVGRQRLDLLPDEDVALE
jgi:hypothetical protein